MQGFSIQVSELLTTLPVRYNFHWCWFSVGSDGSVSNSALHLNLRSLNTIKLYPGDVFSFMHPSLREQLLFHPVLSLVSYQFFPLILKEFTKLNSFRLLLVVTNAPICLANKSLSFSFCSLQMFTINNRFKSPLSVISVKLPSPF